MPLYSGSRTVAVLAACLLATFAPPAPAQERGDPVLEEVVAGSWRQAADRARDVHRHPVESLRFWGLAPGMTLLEIQPGGGWWTDILAPYAHRTGGRYFMTGPDITNPRTSVGARTALESMQARFAAAPDVYGDVGVVVFGAPDAPSLPRESFDFILTARSIHGWLGTPGLLERNLADFFAALKPGGILAIEQHRGGPGQTEPLANGYVREAYVIEQAEKAGFRLAGRSEVNANRKDTRDHPFGVWTLPPVRSSGSPPDPAFDHSRYDAIGESDRMTLRFEKPR